MKKTKIKNSRNHISNYHGHEKAMGIQGILHENPTHMGYKGHDNLDFMDGLLS